MDFVANFLSIVSRVIKPREWTFSEDYDILMT